MKYLVAWGSITDPAVWKTYSKPLGAKETNNTYVIAKSEEECGDNYSIDHVNLSDWLNYYAEEGFKIQKEFQYEDRVVIFLGR